MPPKKSASTAAAAKRPAPSKASKATKSKSEVSVEITAKPTATKKRKASSTIDEQEDEDPSSSEDEKPRKKTKGAVAASGGKKKVGGSGGKGKDVAKANTKVKRSAAGSTVSRTTTGAGKTKSGGKRKIEESEGEEVEEEESKPTKKVKSSAVKKDEKLVAAKKGPAKKVVVKKAIKVSPSCSFVLRELSNNPQAPVEKKAPAPKAQKKQIEINQPPTKPLHIFVFGEGSQGELGLGAKNEGKKTVIDVQRPRLNPFLEKLNVVQIAVGGMHCAALTLDNKIYTWGVNDQGALGRPISDEGKMKNADEDDDSDSDSEDEDSGLNPSEAEPRQVDPAHFPEGTRFAEVFAGDSTTFALTTTGLVYGWGTFRVSLPPFLAFWTQY